MKSHAPSQGMAPPRSKIGPTSKSRDLGRESGRASPAIPHWNFCRRRSECYTTTILGGNYLRRKVFSDVYSYYDHIKLLAEEIGWVLIEFSLLATAITRKLPASHPLLHHWGGGGLHHAPDPKPKSRLLGRRSGRASPESPRRNFSRRRSECHTTTFLGGNYLRRKVFKNKSGPMCLKQARAGHAHSFPSPPHSAPLSLGAHNL